MGKSKLLEGQFLEKMSFKVYILISIYFVIINKLSFSHEVLKVIYSSWILWFYANIINHYNNTKTINSTTAQHKCINRYS